MPKRDYRALLLAPLLILQCAPLASAQNDKSPSATDVAETPLRTVNLSKPKIPPVLERAVKAPYSLAGLNSCKKLGGQVAELNAVLGDDIDTAHAKGEPFTLGRLAQSVADSIIPFSGVIKEVSGANAEKRRLQAAVAAGFARRGFLKGVGLSRRCPAPARPV